MNEHVVEVIANMAWLLSNLTKEGDEDDLLTFLENKDRFNKNVMIVLYLLRSSGAMDLINPQPEIQVDTDVDLYYHQFESDVESLMKVKDAHEYV